MDTNSPSINSTFPTILTGARPTGSLHIGHYFGYLKTCLDLQNSSKMYLMIADVQALTDNWDDMNKVSTAVKNVALDIFALIDDPKKTTVFVQSMIPQIAELTVLFSNLVTINRLQRNPTVKSEISQKKDKFGEHGESITFGFLGYPVSQTADVAVVMADCIPVGIDQVPVLEQAKEILQKFNRLYGDVFPIPLPKLSQNPKIIGLDGNGKMSKSLGNTVFLSSTPEETIAKFKSAKTDSLDYISYDPESRPEISNLVQLFALSNNITNEDAVLSLKNTRYGAFKQELGISFNKYFESFRHRRNELSNNPKILQELIQNGNSRATLEAQKTMHLVRESMGINYKF